MANTKYILTPINNDSNLLARTPNRQVAVTFIRSYLPCFFKDGIYIAGFEVLTFVVVKGSLTSGKERHVDR
jgi:hypothetical protein